MLVVCKPGGETFIKNYQNIKGIKYMIDYDKEKIINEINKFNGIIWLEWGTTNAINVSKIKFDKEIFVRVHDYEIYVGTIDKINWNNISFVWFINKQSRHDFYNRLKIDIPNFYLPNAVDINNFKLDSNKNYGKKIVSYFVKLIPRKNIERLVDIFNALLKKDKEYKLYIRISLYDSSQKILYNKLVKKINRLNITNNVIIQRLNNNIRNFSIKDDINDFLKDKDIFISSSNHEAFHYAIAESMLCGLKPIVYNWEWGRPKDFWKDYVFNNINDIVKQILEWNNLPISKKRELSLSYRDYVIKNYSSQILSNKLQKKLYPTKKILYVTNFLQNEEVEISNGILLKHLKTNGYMVEKHIYSNPEKFTELVEKLKPNLLLLLITNPPIIFNIATKNKIPYILFVNKLNVTNPVDTKYIFDNANEIFVGSIHSANMIKSNYNKTAICYYPPITYHKHDSGGNIKGSILIVTISKTKLMEEFIINIKKKFPNEKIILINYGTHHYGLKYITEIKYSINMHKIYAQGKILLYPAYNNKICGIPETFFEAYSYGIPVVASAVPSFAEKCKNLVKINTINDWFNTINNVIKNYEIQSNEAYQLYLKHDSYTEMDKIVESIDYIL